MKQPGSKKPLRTLLSLVAVAACLPYLSLKVVWVSGGVTGIPAGSPLREGGGTLAAVNALTIVLDALVVVLVLALTRPWGRRLPAWLLTLPLWTATGLLGPILAAFPVQALHGALSGGGAGAESAESAGGSRGLTQNELLDGWVWSTVYTGFVLQGLALCTLFVLYGRERWGRVLRGPVTPRGAAPAVPVRFAVAAGLGALLPGAVHFGRAFGADGFDAAVTEGAFALFALLAAAGLLLAARRGGAGPLRLPLAAVWAGSGVLACWGGWWILSVLTVFGQRPSDAPSALTLSTYAVQMLIGLVIAGFGARLLVRRAALGKRPDPATGNGAVMAAGGQPA